MLTLALERRAYVRNKKVEDRFAKFYDALSCCQDPRQLHNARKDAAKRLKVVVNQKHKERLNSIAHQQQGYSGKGDGPSRIGD